MQLWLLMLGASGGGARYVVLLVATALQERAARIVLVIM